MCYWLKYPGLYWGKIIRVTLTDINLDIVSMNSSSSGECTRLMIHSKVAMNCTMWSVFPRRLCRKVYVRPTLMCEAAEFTSEVVLVASN